LQHALTLIKVASLKKVFEEDYKFVVTEGLLSSQRAPAAVIARAKLSDFVARESDPATLLIVYYAGHGYSQSEDDSGNIKLVGHVMREL